MQWKYLFTASLISALLATVSACGNDDDDDENSCPKDTVLGSEGQCVPVDPPDELCPLGEIRSGEECETVGATFGWSEDALSRTNPFPDDRHLNADGSIAMPEWAFTQFPDPEAVKENTGGSVFSEGLVGDIHTYSTGWGVFSPIELQLDAAVDVDTLPHGWIVLNLDTMEEFNAGFEPTWFGDIHTLDLQPDLPLDSNSTYGVLLTSAVKTASGAPLGYGEDFRRVLAEGAEGDVKKLIDYAVHDLGLKIDEIAGAFVFSTQATWQDLVTIRDRLDSDKLPRPLPGFENLEETEYVEGIFEEGDPMKDVLLGPGADLFKLAAVGTVPLYDFRDNIGVYDPALVENEIPPTNLVRFNMTLSNQPKPPNGYPIVILGHGLGMSADFTWDIAEFAHNFPDMPAMAFIAHDNPAHGARGTGEEIGDLLAYFNISNFFAMRDSFRQTACEYVQMRTMIQAAAESGVPPFDQVDPDRILYAGASLGGINGATFLAVDSVVEVGFLSVPSGELVRILEGEEVGGIAAPFLAGMAGFTEGDADYDYFFRILMNRGLWLMGAGDSINYAPFIQREANQLPGATRKSVLIQMGIGDGVLPNRTTWDLARVMGVEKVDQEVTCQAPGCRVSGLWEFDYADYAHIYGENLINKEPHQVSAELDEAQAQLIEYLASDGSSIYDASPAE